MRLLALAGLAGLAAFFWYLLQPERRGDAWLFWLFLAGLGYRALFWMVEWFYYVRPRVEEATGRAARSYTVDVLTTACPGEPRGMILRTLLAMKAMPYPHTDYLCDEGDDPVLKEACRELGVIHVTRKDKTHFKAGNINNALRQATGEIAIVLDPDHEPAPYMIERVLEYFDDPKVGFVQSTQVYRNTHDSLVADGAAKQTYLFYGPIMIGMNAYGTTQAIGANCVFRRAALDSIGGHASGLAEDMHTTIRLYAQGWTSKYIPEVLTRGLVPSTLSAYCKQQLKWACGSIDLLLRIYPKCFRGMTGWQRLQYGTGPLYFMRGVFGALNIAIPIICLAFGGVALRINIFEYLAMLVPVLGVSIVLRQFAQRWTIEPREHGAHLVGGLLGTGTWFVFLQGFLCGVFKVKLPYIPTPKDNDVADSWGLAVPNLAASALSIAAVIYGLWTDWTPFNAFMACLALWNVGQLLFVAALGQQKTLQRVRRFLGEKKTWLSRVFALGHKAVFETHAFAIRTLRERSLAVAVPVLLAALAAIFWPKSKLPEEAWAVRFKNTGGFYAGAHAGAPQLERALGVSFRLVPLEQPWGAAQIGDFPEAAMRAARQRGAVPLLTWNPGERGATAAILSRRYDDYVKAFATKLREFADPVLLRFAPRADDPSAPLAASPAEFVAAWVYLAAIFNDAGASNVGWVWQPASPEAFEGWYPGRAFVDWVAIRAVNQGGGSWREFADLYAPYRARLKADQLPVLISDLGSTDLGGSRADWLARALANMATDFPEIRGALLRTDGWLEGDQTATLQVLAAGLALPQLRERSPTPPGLWREQARSHYVSPHIAGGPGQYELRVDGQPFYIRGIAYNPGHDWRDNHTPLTRRELRSDFSRLRATGANTIRRYGRGWADRNLLRTAQEHRLKVLYGFWFDQDLDYVATPEKLVAYTAEVEATVRAWRDEPALLAWSLGNEVWGLLKHHFAQPYLTEVRHAHIDFVEHLARRIHALDPKRPVFAVHEHSAQLAGTFADFALGAPSLDFTGVNSYYEDHIARLRGLAESFDPGRPYLVSEFGPDGYWDAGHAQRTDFGALLEPATLSKVRQIERGWSLHTAPHRGANIGGVAYCWRNRIETTATWFGITDALGRPKPEYLALQKMWTGRAEAEGPRLLAIEGPDEVLAPGATFEVTAHVNSAPGPLRFAWTLHDAQFTPGVGRIRPLGDGAKARITLPKKPGAYRLYVNVSDGQVADEANLPLLAEGAGDEIKARTTAATGIRLRRP